MTPQSIQEAAERAGLKIRQAICDGIRGSADPGFVFRMTDSPENIIIAELSALQSAQPAAVADGAKEPVCEYGTTTVAAAMEAHRKFGESVRSLYKPTPPAEPSAEGGRVAAIRGYLAHFKKHGIQMSGTSWEQFFDHINFALATLEKAERERDAFSGFLYDASSQCAQHQARITALEAELKEAREKQDQHWLLLCRTVEAMGQISPEAAPYADQWAAKLKLDRDNAEARATALQALVERAEKRMNDECGKAALRVNQAMELLGSEHAAHKDTQEALAVSKSLCRNSVEEIGADLAASRKQVAELTEELAKTQKALASSCDEERSLIVSEGPPHSMCGLAKALTDELAQWREMAVSLDRKVIEEQTDHCKSFEHFTNALRAIEAHHVELNRKACRDESRSETLRLVRAVFKGSCPTPARITALEAALEAIKRRVPIAGSTGDYREGQLHALEACREVAQDALAPAPTETEKEQ